MSLSSPFAVTKSDCQRGASEHGAALIVVLMMLLLLSILGMTLLTSSTTELQIAGNYRTSQQAFYTADAILEFAQTDPAAYTAIVPGVQNKYSSAVVKVGDNAATYKVEFVGTGMAPPGSGSDDSFQSYFYMVDVSGSGPNGAAAELESEVARVVPKVKDY